jgi:hypothetical protein
MMMMMIIIIIIIISTDFNTFSQAIPLSLCAKQIYYGGGLKFGYQ